MPDFSGSVQHRIQERVRICSPNVFLGVCPQIIGAPEFFGDVLNLRTCICDPASEGVIVSVYSPHLLSSTADPFGLTRWELVV